MKIDPERDLAHLAYTGGTRGLSKGVMLTHKAVVTNTLQFAHWASGGWPVLGDDGLLSIGGRSDEGGEPDPAATAAGGSPANG